MYPWQHYIHNPCGGPNMCVWTDLHTVNDWWSLLVLSPLPLFRLMITISPGQDQLGKGHDSHMVILGCHTTKQYGVKEELGGLDVHQKHPPGALGQSEEEGGCCYIPEVCVIFLSHTSDLNGTHRSLENQWTQIQPLLITMPGSTMQHC